MNDNLPPGWDCMVDEKTGRYYYVNHLTKTTTWDDPRHRHRPFQTNQNHFTNMSVEHIPLQHGSPDLRRNCIYPRQSSPIPAFQIPGQRSPKSIPLQEFRSVRMSPLSIRGNKVQDSSLTIVPDTDEAVSKINTMFPTVPETHIRMLMKKYHNREALVISALQVEKYPITTPGPFATPPPQRNIYHPVGMHAPMHMTPPLGLRNGSRGGSPIFRPGSGSNSTYTGSPRIGDGFRNSPRPHSSPKLKLSCRYMKSIFPQAEETVILEILQGNENNIQKASDILKEMGFDKKDTVKAAQQKLDAKKEEESIEKEEVEKPAPPPPRLKTTEEKAAMKEKLKEKYPDVVEQLISIALESVDFDENRANQILQIMVQEDTKKNEETNKLDVKEEEIITELDSPAPASTIPISQSRMSIKSLLKNERNEKEKITFNRVIENDENYRSSLLSNTRGPNSDFIKGANENLLLEDYVKWQGPNASLHKGSQGLAKGPNKSLISNRSYTPCGPNAELRKGPKFGLATGSIFSQMKTVIVGEARGK